MPALVEPGYLEATAADRTVALTSGLVELEGHAVVRPVGSLGIAPARALIVERSVRAAFEPDGSVAADTLRFARTTGGMTLVDEIPPRRSDRPVAHVIDQPVIWGGPNTNHYGHFLTETVARLWPLLPGGPLEGLPVVFTTPAMSPFAAEWLDGFGAELVRLPTGPVNFTQMYVPQPSWVMDVYCAPEFLDTHRHARGGIDVRRLDPQGIVWLSRARLEPAARRVLDEVLFERLAGSQLTIIHPERLSLAEQIAVLEASDGVCGILGSAFHTLLLAQEPPRSVYMCPRRVPSPFVLQDHLLGGTGVFARTLALEKERKQGAGRPNPHRLLIPETLRAIERALLPGLLSAPELAAAAYPELHTSRTAAPGAESDCADRERLAVAALSIDPHAYGPRLEVGDILESAGLSDDALTQFRAATQLGEDAWYGRLRVARLLWNLGLREDAAEAARLVLPLLPDCAEALEYIAAVESE